MCRMRLWQWGSPAAIRSNTNIMSIRRKAFEVEAVDDKKVIFCPRSHLTRIKGYALLRPNSALPNFFYTDTVIWKHLEPERRWGKWQRVLNVAVEEKLIVFSATVQVVTVQILISLVRTATEAENRNVLNVVVKERSIERFGVIWEWGLGSE